jgi:hypothetical protein
LLPHPEVQALPRPHTPIPQTPFAAIIEEGLGMVLAPDRLWSVIDEALSQAGLDEIPERPSKLRVFVEGALFTTLARHLDASDALELVSQIRSSLELALAGTADERPFSDVHRRDTLPAPPSRVIVVTQASLVVFLLQDVLSDSADVVAINTVAELSDRLRRLHGQPVLVVVDRKHACTDLSVCELLRVELDSDSVVVWWGAPTSEQAEVSSLLRDGPRAIACQFDLRLSDLGDLCQRLLQSPA